MSKATRKAQEMLPTAQFYITPSENIWKAIFTSKWDQEILKKTCCTSKRNRDLKYVALSLENSNSNLFWEYFCWAHPSSKSSSSHQYAVASDKGVEAEITQQSLHPTHKWRKRLKHSLWKLEFPTEFVLLLKIQDKAKQKSKNLHTQRKSNPSWHFWIFVERYHF